MPLPSASQLHVNQLLTDLSVMYVNAPASFISPVAFPVVPVIPPTLLHHFRVTG